MCWWRMGIGAVCRLMVCRLMSLGEVKGRGVWVDIVWIKYEFGATWPLGGARQVFSVEFLWSLLGVVR